MSAKYSRLPTNDPDSVTIDFNSIHDYENEGEFNSGLTFDEDKIIGQQSTKYKSAFTYSDGFDPQKRIETVEVVEQSLGCKICANIVVVLCYIIVVITFPITAWFSMKNIQSYERLVIYRLGRLVGAKGPGMVFVIPCIDAATKVDLRMKAFSIPPQKGLTMDGATVEVGAEVYYRVKDPTLSISNVQDLNRSTRVISESILQKHLCRYDMSDLNTKKEAISQTLISDINQMTLTWGVEVTRATMSQVKVISEPNPLVHQGSNPLSFLGPILFPSGQSNMPLDQLPAVPGFSKEGQSLDLPIDPSKISPKMLTQIKQQELEHLQKQYPHLKNELNLLMKAKVADDATGASGPVQSHTLRYKSPHDLLKAVVPKLNSDLVEEFMCIYKFIVTGPGGGTFYLDLKNHDGDADEGEPRMGKADVTLRLSMSDLDSLLTGQSSAFAAYMTGRIEVEGEMAMASKLGDIVELLK